MGRSSVPQTRPAHRCTGWGSMPPLDPRRWGPPRHPAHQARQPGTRVSVVGREPAQQQGRQGRACRVGAGARDPCHTSSTSPTHHDAGAVILGGVGLQPGSRQAEQQQGWFRGCVCIGAASRQASPSPGAACAVARTSHQPSAPYSRSGATSPQLPGELRRHMCAMGRPRRVGGVPGGM